MRLWLLALAAVAGCGTVRVQYPGGTTRPKLVTMQMYTASSRGSDGEVPRYSESLQIEAGCLKAAHLAGVDFTVRRSKGISVETDEDVTYLKGNVDARRVANMTGADTIITGMARVTPRSQRVTSLRLEAQAPNGTVLAIAEYANLDGVDAMEAGDTVCTELFKAWGNQTTRDARPLPRTIYIPGNPKNERSARFRQGCEAAVAEAGLQVLPHVVLERGPGTLWQRLGAATAAEGYLLWDYSVPLSDPLTLQTAIVWLTDARGVLLGTRIFRPGMLAGEPGAVGNALCKSVFGR
jgi:hypothetical protein